MGFCWWFYSPPPNAGVTSTVGGSANAASGFPRPGDGVDDSRGRRGEAARARGRHVCKPKISHVRAGSVRRGSRCSEEHGDRPGTGFPLPSRRHSNQGTLSEVPSEGGRSWSHGEGFNWHGLTCTGFNCNGFNWRGLERKGSKCNGVRGNGVRGNSIKCYLMLNATTLDATALNATTLDATALNATALDATGLRAMALDATVLRAMALNAATSIATPPNEVSKSLGVFKAPDPVAAHPPSLPILSQHNVCNELQLPGCSSIPSGQAGKKGVVVTGALW